MPWIWSLNGFFNDITKNKEVYSCRESWIPGNRQYKIRKVLSEVLSFVGNPVCQKGTPRLAFKSKAYYTPWQFVDSHVVIRLKIKAVFQLFFFMWHSFEMGIRFHERTKYLKTNELFCERTILFYSTLKNHRFFTKGRILLIEETNDFIVRSFSLKMN